MPFMEEPLTPRTPATPNQTPRTRRRRRRRAVDLDDFKRKGGGTPRSRRRGLSVRFEPSKVGIGAKPRSVSVGPAREDLGGLGDDLVAVGRALRAVADGGRPAPWAELCDEDRAGASRELLAAVKDLYEQLTDTAGFD